MVPLSTYAPMFTYEGIITTPAGGKYQAMKYVYVKNASTGKRLTSDTITLSVGGAIRLAPDYEYPVKDYKKRPRLYPTQALWDLDAAGKEIVTGLYFKRRSPFSPVLYEELGCNEETGEFHFKDLEDLPASREPFEVAGCGMGCCIITKGVMLDLLLNCQTWFTPMLNFGEDLAFCIRANQLNHKIWCDPTISCGHIGQLIINEQIWQTMPKEKAPATK